MKIAIIEDELLAVNYLKDLLDKQSIVSVTETIILRSKKQAIDFFENNSADLIFMDIHLGDGMSLEIFEYVELFTLSFLSQPLTDMLCRFSGISL